MSRVVVFGSGFDSLLAVHAASVLGHDVKIYAEDTAVETEIESQLLMAPIPMVDGVKCASFSLVGRGPQDAFMDKLLNQAGRGIAPEVLNENIDGRMIWDSAAVYDWLVETYLGFATIVPDGIGFKEVRTILADLTPDTAFSGIDRDEICGDKNHAFAAAAIVTMPAPVTAAGYNQITVSGDPDDSWAMESHIFGKSWRSYGAHRHPPVSRSKLGGYILPQGTGCDCHTADVSFVGKLGAWDPIFWRHRSFYRPFAELGLA